MRRFVTSVALVFFAVPFGVSISGCHHNIAPTYCNGQNSGVQVGQLTTLDLEPRLTGISLNQGEMGRVNAPAGKDCRGSSASTSNVVYASTNINLADVAPSTGSLCAGSWNRNTGASIPDYTVCTPATTNGVAYVTASAEGVVSNAIPVFIHPVVTSIVLGAASTNCTTDPASNCVNLSKVGGFDTGIPVNTSPSYSGTSCLSQGQTAQLVARTYGGATNISNLVGPLQFSAQSPSVVTIDANGVATAAQPGSSTISANISQASSTAGFFSTCPPASIALSTPAGATSVSVNQNTSQPLTAIVKDTNGNQITNVQLTYVSTSPTTIPAGSNTIVPTYPGAAAITAVCQPPTCNPSPFNEIGLFGNGTPITSNFVQIKSTGTNFSSVIYIASTQSQYLLPYDFTTTTQVAPVRLPYTPNSMVMSEDLSTIYMGASDINGNPIEIMTYSTTSNSLVKQDTSLSGYVLSVSPDNGTVIITDPVRGLTYLYLASGGVSTETGGVATSAAWTPDSSTVYITTTDGRLLVHSTFTGWSSKPLTSLATSVAVTVPSAGVYLGGNPVDVRTNCPATQFAFPVNTTNPSQPYNPAGFGKTVNGNFVSQTTTNNFYPDLGPVAGVSAVGLAATNDGAHILGASTTVFTDVTTQQVTQNCPADPVTSPVIKSGVNNAVSIATLGAVPSPDVLTTNYVRPLVTPYVVTTSDSAYAFISYQVAAAQATPGVVPQYAIGTGSLTNVPLQKTNGTPTAPVAEAVSADNNTLYVGTSGDNVVHILTRGTGGFSDATKPIVPSLPVAPTASVPNPTGIAVPNLLVQRPRKSTS